MGCWNIALAVEAVVLAGWYMRAQELCGVGSSMQRFDIPAPAVGYLAVACQPLGCCQGAGHGLDKTRDLPFVPLAAVAFANQGSKMNVTDADHKSIAKYLVVFGAAFAVARQTLHCSLTGSQNRLVGPCLVDCGLHRFGNSLLSRYSC